MFRTVLMLTAWAFLLPGLGFAAQDEDQCRVLENEVASSFYSCLTKASRLDGKQRARRDWRCSVKMKRHAKRADRRGDCDIQADQASLANVVEQVNEDFLCDPETVNLLDFEAWDRENGFWIGHYTFLGADGNPNQSSSWPYRYDDYKGYIHLQVVGNSIRQRNVFLYPAQETSLCTGDPNDVKGDGTCGFHGNEKIYSADQTASNCRGSLEGRFVTKFGNADTYTTLSGDNRVLYEVVFASYPFKGHLMQSQLTTLPGNDTRVRSAQGFNVVTGEPSYGSFYRERKVSAEEFWADLEATRIEYNIRAEDECAWDGVTNEPTGISCAEHFEN